MLPVILSRLTNLSQIAAMDVWFLLSISFILSILLLILFYVHNRIVCTLYFVRDDKNKDVQSTICSNIVQ